MLFKLGALKDFSEFAGKHLCGGPFYKVASIKPATLLKNDTDTDVFR